jgi:hypothetical protein
MHLKEKTNQKNVKINKNLDINTLPHLTRKFLGKLGVGKVDCSDKT